MQGNMPVAPFVLRGKGLKTIDIVVSVGDTAATVSIGQCTRMLVQE